MHAHEGFLMISLSKLFTCEKKKKTNSYLTSYWVNDLNCNFDLLYFFGSFHVGITSKPLFLEAFFPSLF